MVTRTFDGYTSITDQSLCCDNERIAAWAVKSYDHLQDPIFKLCKVDDYRKTRVLEDHQNIDYLNSLRMKQKWI